MTLALNDLTAILERLAPLHLAEPWDNVGLLIAPPRRRTVRQALLTVDLTDAVLDEAVERKVDFILAYHPPLFHPLKRLDGRDLAGRLALAAVERAIAVYSPHTALDAAPGGVNDWLAGGLGAGRVEPLQRQGDGGGSQVKVVVFVPKQATDRLHQAMSRAGAGIIGHYSHCAWLVEGTGRFLGESGARPAVGQAGRLEEVAEHRLEMICSQQALPAVAQAIAEHHPYEQPAWEVYRLADRPLPHTGQGRRLVLHRAARPHTLVRRVKKHLGLEHVRVAWGADRPVRTVALCAGAGGSVLRDQPAEVYLTGEMRHHDILAANARGITVILTDHSHSERPYLAAFKQRLEQATAGKVAWLLSRRDAEPLQIV